jgi:DNA-binding GntR family transcriptional regulator
VSLPAIQRIEPPTSLRAHVEKVLSAAIISGEMAPNTLLTVPTLAVQFNVSATPVREAMLDLEKRGFVEPVRNKGFRVTDVSDDALRQIVEVRQLLPSEQFDELSLLANRIVDGARSGDLRAYLEADQDFHLRLTRMLGNSVLVETVADLRSRTRLVGLAAMLESRRLIDSAEEHVALLDLLSAGDGAAARRLMHQHIHHALGWWSGKPEGGA